LEECPLNLGIERKHGKDAANPKVKFMLNHFSSVAIHFDSILEYGDYWITMDRILLSQEFISFTINHNNLQSALIVGCNRIEQRHHPCAGLAPWSVEHHQDWIM
jgi:hypothetical protein